MSAADVSIESRRRKLKRRESGSYGVTLMNGTLFLPTTAGSIFAFTSAAGVFHAPAAASETNTYGFPGPAQMSGSSNGTASGILWITTAAASSFTATQPGTLRALNVSTLTELWNSDTSGHDTPGSLSKYAKTLTIANGKVFVATQDGQVKVFGLLSAVTVRGKVTVRGLVTIR